MLRIKANQNDELDNIVKECENETDLWTIGPKDNSKFKIYDENLKFPLLRDNKYLKKKTVNQGYFSNLANKLIKSIK